MAIEYSPERWTRLAQHYSSWRQSDSGEPIMGFITHRDPGRSAPAAPVLSQSTCADFSWSADALADRLYYELECLRFKGDAFPAVNMSSFGPGVAAAFCGAQVEISSTGNVWFKAPDRPIDRIHIRFDEDNPWFRRICDIYEACVRRFEGDAVLSMTDLGGTADVVATFVGSQNLLYALYDDPDEVKRLMDEAHTAWWQAYDRINDILKKGGVPGYSDWFGLYYPEPGGYILQCDFCYMIGPAMFREFIQPELTRSAAKLTWPVYHWDGPGELVHFDALASVEPRLQAIQWVPGDGNPPQPMWPQVLSRIGSAGRKILLYEGTLEEMEAIAALPGVRRGALYRQPIYLAQDEFDKR